jgi:sister chromatid cohesion protein PDS5
MANATADEAMDIFKPVLKMLNAILAHDGSLTANAVDAYVLVSHYLIRALIMSSISPQVKSRLRLQAAVSMLHLSTVAAFANPIAVTFVDLAITVQVGRLSCLHGCPLVPIFTCSTLSITSA